MIASVYGGYVVVLQWLASAPVVVAASNVNGLTPFAKPFSLQNPSSYITLYAAHAACGAGMLDTPIVVIQDIDIVPWQHPKDIPPYGEVPLLCDISTELGNGSTVILRAYWHLRGIPWHEFENATTFTFTHNADGSAQWTRGEPLNAPERFATPAVP